MAHGWLDGRRGLPSLPHDSDWPSRALNGSVVQTTNGHGKPAVPSPAWPGGAEPPAVLVKPVVLPHDNGTASPRPRLRTSRMEVLARQALELIEEEKIKFADEWAVLKRESAQFLTLRDALTREVAEGEDKIRQARIPISEEEIEGRRYAELDPRRRPAELVRPRRRAAGRMS